MMLTCRRCGRKHPVTEDEVAFFYPRFFCLTCGDKVPFPVDEEKVLALRRSNDRDRRLTDANGIRGQEGVRKVWKDEGVQESDGG